MIFRSTVRLIIDKIDFYFEKLKQLHVNRL